jgi:hypothetical protein
MTSKYLVSLGVAEGYWYAMILIMILPPDCASIPSYTTEEEKFFTLEGTVVNIY